MLNERCDFMTSCESSVSFPILTDTYAYTYSIWPVWVGVRELTPLCQFRRFGAIARGCRCMPSGTQRTTKRVHKGR